MKIFQPTISGSFVVTGSAAITGSLNVTQGITGSLQGTASAVDVSYVLRLIALGI
jgi:hypothetical protein